MLDRNNGRVKDRPMVLVVDDNSVNIIAAKAMLKVHGIIPDSALSGQEAIKLIKENKYDIIFMDYLMPGMDGLETTSFIRSLGGYCEVTPIIALTADVESGARKFLIENGMTDFISKPINAVALDNIITKYLPSHKTHCSPMQPESFKEAEELSSFLSDVSKLAELDVEWGLSHMDGNPDAYKMALNQLVYEIPQYINDLYIDILNKQPEHYAIIVHGMKGSFITVGAEALAESAFILEKSAKAYKWEICVAKTACFSEAVIAFLKILKPVLKKNEPSPVEDKAHASVEELAQTLAPLKLACILGDCSTIDNITDRLKKLSFGEQYDSDISEIIKLADYMDYSKAADKVEKLIKLLVLNV